MVMCNHQPSYVSDAPTHRLAHHFCYPPLPCRSEVLVMVMRKHQRYFPVHKHQSGGQGV